MNHLFECLRYFMVAYLLSCYLMLVCMSVWYGAVSYFAVSALVR